MFNTTKKNKIIIVGLFLVLLLIIIGTIWMMKSQKKIEGFMEIYDMPYIPPDAPKVMNTRGYIIPVVLPQNGEIPTVPSAQQSMQNQIIPIYPGQQTLDTTITTSVTEENEQSLINKIVERITGRKNGNEQVAPVTPIINQPINPIQITDEPITGTSNLDSEAQLWLNEHNRVRNSLGLSSVTWNESLAQDARNYANVCKFEHSPQSSRMVGNTVLGENLAYGSPFSYYDDEKMFALWEEERKFYSHPMNPNSEQGHYTQIINKNVTEIGCGCSNCSGNKICVCRYNPIQLGNQAPY